MLIAGAPAAAAVGGLGYAVIGASAGGGMDAAGQYAQTGTIRLAESEFAATTGAVAGPIGANVGFVSNVLLGVAGSGVNTAFNNAFYGETNSLSFASGLGAFSSAIGFGIGVATTKGLSQILQPYVYENFNPGVAALLQPRTPNSIPGFAGAMTGSIGAGTSSFVPGKEAPK